MLLDSTFLNDLIRGDEDAVDMLDDLIADETPVVLSPLSVFEVGIGLRGEAVRFRERFQGVDDVEPVPLGVVQVEEALAIQRELLDRGEPIGAVDVLLAGTAATLADSRVLTRNVDEFERVSGIEVVGY